MSGGGHSDMIVFARFGSASGAGGIGAVFVPKETEGVSFGPGETLMGFRGIPSADIFFEKVTVPKENLLLPAGQFSKLMKVFNLERCGYFSSFYQSLSLGFATHTRKEQQVNNNNK